MNAVRTKLFEKKYTKEGKAIDMSLLPPCNSVLILDIKQANYVVKISKFSLTNWLHSDAISENGWHPDDSPYWVDHIFPRDVEEILWTLPLSAMILTNLMSETSCQMTMMKIKTMMMISDNIDTDCFQYSFKRLS